MAEKARAVLADGRDPIALRKAERDAAQVATAANKATAKAEATTLARVARRYDADVIEPQRTPKHAEQWIASLEQGVPAELWHAPIDSIEPAALLKALAALQLRLPETASRVRQRLEVVLGDAQFHRLCTENAARVVKRIQAGQLTAADLAEVERNLEGPGCTAGNFVAARPRFLESI